MTEEARLRAILVALDEWFNRPDNHFSLGGTPRGVIAGAAHLLDLARFLAEKVPDRELPRPD